MQYQHLVTIRVTVFPTPHDKPITPPARCSDIVYWKQDLPSLVGLVLWVGVGVSGRHRLSVLGTLYSLQSYRDPFSGAALQRDQLLHCMLIYTLRGAGSCRSYTPRTLVKLILCLRNCVKIIRACQGRDIS